MHIFFNKFYNNIVCSLIFYMWLAKLNRIFFLKNKFVEFMWYTSIPNHFYVISSSDVSSFLSRPVGFKFCVRNEKTSMKKFVFFYIFWLISSVRNTHKQISGFYFCVAIFRCCFCLVLTSLSS